MGRWWKERGAGGERCRLSSERVNNKGLIDKENLRCEKRKNSQATVERRGKCALIDSTVKIEETNCGKTGDDGWVKVEKRREGRGAGALKRRGASAGTAAAQGSDASSWQQSDCVAVSQ